MLFETPLCPKHLVVGQSCQVAFKLPTAYREIAYVFKKKVIQYGKDQHVKCSRNSKKGEGSFRSKQSLFIG